MPQLLSARQWQLLSRAREGEDKTRQGQEQAECAMSRACVTGSREGMGSLV